MNYNYNKGDKVGINRPKIIKCTSLQKALSGIIDKNIIEGIRRYWESIYNPWNGWRYIHHRSQAKARRQFKRRGF